ncbi:hypothetical protein JCM14036_12710 [Desulfotomaculum defluvii]
MKGSIEWRGKDTARLVISGARDINGKQFKKSKTIHPKSPKDAEEQLAIFLAEVLKGEYIEDKNWKFKDLVDKWYSAHALENLTPKTIHRYMELLDHYILPAIGHLKLDSIKPLHLKDFYTSLQKDGIRRDGKKGGLSEKTIKYIHRTISTILEHAVNWELLLSNPAKKVKPPRVPKHEIKCYDEEQVNTLLNALVDE